MKDSVIKGITLFESSRLYISKFLRWVLVLILYLITFIIIDQVTQPLQLYPGVVAWYPPDGLSLAFLLTFGVCFAPAILVTSLISSLIIYRLSTPFESLLVWAVILSALYGLSASLLRRRIRIDLQLNNIRDTLWLILTSSIVSTILAVISVTNMVNLGDVPAPQYFNAIIQWWIGEMIGVLVFAPFLLIYIMPWVKRFIDEGWANLKPQIIIHRLSHQTLGQIISIPLVIYLVFGIPPFNGFQPFYLIAGPLLWIALTNGFSKVSLAVLAMNIGIIPAIWLFKFDPSRLGELQFLMFGIYLSALLTGAIVSNQKRTAEELRRSGIHNRALIENAPDGITLLGADGLLNYVSPSTQRILGYPSEEFIGSNPAEYVHPDDYPALLKLLDELSQMPGMVAVTQYRFRHHDGSWRWLENTITNLLAKPGVQAIVFNFRDITEPKQAEERIKISNDELSVLFTLSQALAEADSLNDILNLVNRHAVESVHSTFARIALLEGENYIFRGVYPLRILDYNLGLGQKYPAASLPSSQRILEQSEAVVLHANDTEIGSQEKKILLLDFAQSVCLVPLRISDSSPISDKLLGLLMLGEVRNEGREPFTPDKKRLAQTIGNSAAIAIRRLLLREQTERRMQQLVALSQIDLAIITSSDMVFTMGVLLLQTIDKLKIDAANAWLYNPTLQMLELVTGRGFQTQAFANAKRLSLGEGIAGRAALERRTIHISDLAVYNDHQDFKKALAVEPFISYYAVPLIVKDQVKGVLELFHHTEHEPNEEWLNFLHALVNQAAIAIDNYSLFNDLQQSNAELTQAYDATIQGWSRALDLRDKETEGHTQRVTELTTKLGSQFGFSEEELIHVRRGALLHDIGKMGVPDKILLKPGPLTDEEWILMKKHPTFAYELLSPIPYLQPALDIPYCHHEKWDGTGYPRGLSGEQIPFSARIFAVIDVWDALISDRPYRAAWPEEKVLDHVRSLAGIHFDPQVVKICLELDLLKIQLHQET